MLCVVDQDIAIEGSRLRRLLSCRVLRLLFDVRRWPWRDMARGGTSEEVRQMHQMLGMWQVRGGTMKDIACDGGVSRNPPMICVVDQDVAMRDITRGSYVYGIGGSP